MKQLMSILTTGAVALAATWFLTGLAFFIVVEPGEKITLSAPFFVAPIGVCFLSMYVLVATQRAEKSRR